MKINKNPMLVTSGANNYYSRKSDYNTRQMLIEAQNQWPWILESLGIDAAFLKNQHGPCPFCNGKDRFRFDNKEGKGTFICNQCGAGYGLQFVTRFLDCSYAEAVKKVSDLLRINHRSDFSNDTPNTFENVKAKANYIVDESSPCCDTHPYLLSKQIQSDHLKSYKGSLVIEVFQKFKERVSLQLIKPNGEKIFLKGTPKKGSYSLIGQHSQHYPLIITEGFATAASIYQSLNIPVFIAFDAGNIKGALQTILSNFQFNGTIIIAADNDKSEVGFRAAKNALESLQRKGYIIMPEPVDTDWNDIYIQNGKGAVKSVFAEVWK